MPDSIVRAPQQRTILDRIGDYFQKSVMDFGRDMTKFERRQPKSEGIYAAEPEILMGELDPPFAKLGKLAKAAEKFTKIAVRSQSGIVKTVDHLKGGHIEAINRLPLKEQAVGKKIEDGMLTSRGRFVKRPVDKDGNDIEGVNLIGKRVSDFVKQTKPAKQRGASSIATDIAISGKYTPDQLRVIHKSETDRINALLSDAIASGDMDALSEVSVLATENQKWREAAEILEGTHKGPGMNVYRQHLKKLKGK